MPSEMAMTSVPSVPVLESMERSNTDFSDSTRDGATISLITESLKPDVYKRDKDVVRRHHVNRRVSKKRDHHSDFVILCCDGRQETSKEMITKFKKLDEGDKASKDLATEMLRTLNEMGAKERMLRVVFGIGSTRYQRVVSGKPARVGGGKNVNAVNDSMIASISEMVAQLPTANGNPCMHGRMISYCIDPNINTWMKLFRFYEIFLNGKEVRKMGFSTFFNYVKACHPDLRLTRLEVDFCECCSGSQEEKNVASSTARRRDGKRGASSDVSSNDAETEETPPPAHDNTKNYKKSKLSRRRGVVV